MKFIVLFKSFIQIMKLNFFFLSSLDVCLHYIHVMISSYVIDDNNMILQHTYVQFDIIQFATISVLSSNIAIANRIETCERQ